MLFFDVFDVLLQWVTLY